MKILAIGNCELSPFLGSGKTRLAWSGGLRALGHTVDVLQPRDYECVPALRKAKRVRLAWGARMALVRRLREERYDIIESFGGEIGWAIRHLAARKERPLLIAHTDGIELLAYYEGAIPPDCPPPFWQPRALNRYLHQRLDYTAFRYADRFVALSKEDRDYVIARGLFAPEHASTIAPGIDAAFLGRPFAPAATAHIAYFGTWTERKNPAATISVIGSVLAKRPAAIFNVFGASGAAPEIVAAFPEAVRERIVVHPRLPVEELADRVAQCAVVFFPSLYEGFGMALAEAMGCGCAAVATPTGFGAELRDGVEALIRPARDFAALEEALLALLDDAPRRLSLARAGWECVQSLVWERKVAALERLYLDWLH